MALREGLPSNMLYVDRAFMMKTFIVVVVWHGGFPRVSTSYIDPRGSTLSLENPLKWAFTGSNFSLPMPILSNADAKMMSAELPLLIRTLWTVLLATMTLITSGSSWGCWKPSKSTSEKVMVVSNRGSLDTTYTSSVSPNLKLCRWAFLAELDSSPSANPLEITLISLRGLLMLSRGRLTRWWRRFPVSIFGSHVTTEMNSISFFN